MFKTSNLRLTTKVLTAATASTAVTVVNAAAYQSLLSKPVLVDYGAPSDSRSVMDCGEDNPQGASAHYSVDCWAPKAKTIEPKPKPIEPIKPKTRVTLQAIESLQPVNDKKSIISRVDTPDSSRSTGLASSSRPSLEGSRSVLGSVPSSLTSSKSTDSANFDIKSKPSNSTVTSLNNISDRKYNEIFLKFAKLEYTKSVDSTDNLTQVEILDNWFKLIYSAITQDLSITLPRSEVTTSGQVTILDWSGSNTIEWQCRNILNNSIQIGTSDNSAKPQEKFAICNELHRLNGEFSQLIKANPNLSAEIDDALINLATSRYLLSYMKEKYETSQKGSLEKDVNQKLYGEIRQMSEKSYQSIAELIRNTYDNLVSKDIKLMATALEPKDPEIEELKHTTVEAVQSQRPSFPLLRFNKLDD